MRYAALVGLVVAGCTWRGPFTRTAAPQTDEVTIALVGGAGTDGRSARATAAALERAGPRVVVLLDDRPSRRLDARRRTAGPTPIASVLRDRTLVTIAGSAAHAVPNEGDRLVRITGDGKARVASRCEARTCMIAPPGEDDRLELVLVDLERWHRARLGNDALAELEGLLAALRTTPVTAPRVLVTYLPVEGGFERGLGALVGPRASFHQLPQVLQRAIEDGVFVGAIAGGEWAVHASRDLSPAIQRTDKTWLRAPMWQVVSGSATAPAAGHGRAWRRTKLGRGIGFQPELATDHVGFAVLTIGERDAATLDVHARRVGRWWRARTELPLRPEPFRGPRDAAAMAPCMRCDEVPASERR